MNLVALDDNTALTVGFIVLCGAAILLALAALCVYLRIMDRAARPRRDADRTEGRETAPGKGDSHAR